MPIKYNVCPKCNNAFEADSKCSCSAEPAKEGSSTEWLDVLAKIVRCFSDREGTRYQRHWKYYGVTPEQERMIEAAVARQERTSNVPN